MRTHYDFAGMKSRKNPYITRLKKSITIRLDRDTIVYFKTLAQETGLPYQHLINMYLRDCADNRRQVSIRWVPRMRRTSAALPQGRTANR